LELTVVFTYLHTFLFSVFYGMLWRCLVHVIFFCPFLFVLAPPPPPLVLQK
jgi:hypothetical protein